MYFSEQLLFSVVINLFILNCTAQMCDVTLKSVTENERLQLKEEVRDMFYHAYNAYMENAYPADELMPLSCRGRYRGITPSRGDLDDALGNFSLTLIDTLDTLLILGDFEEFEHAVKLVIRDVKLNNDIVVSVFETNIRILGGLLSGHILAKHVQAQYGTMIWYQKQLLDMATDIADRLLPAFDTGTGIPHARVNLKNGLNTPKLSSAQETCTACGGSMILEMVVLSRLTGRAIYEKKSKKAMDELWKSRNRGSDLMGTILNVHTGEWVRKNAGVGAGIDSYYEYLLKSYILFGDKKYLNRFNMHYEAISNYITRGAMLLDVYMHRPLTTSRLFMDALIAFWPGLQVLKGDIKSAVETHELLYQVMAKHEFIPEAFTTDFQVYWTNHPIRPEFVESTYFLYQATGDPYYLEVGRKVLENIQKYTRVSCGYAAIGDVRNKRLEDRMDSFVLSETFKYLYLLFSNKSEHILDIDKFIFSTEGHMFPLIFNKTKTHLELDLHESDNDMTCTDPDRLPMELFRKRVRNLYGMCPKEKPSRKLTAKEFKIENLDHRKLLHDMGIETLVSDGKLQLIHNPLKAISPLDAVEGMVFLEDLAQIIESEPPPKYISVTIRTKKIDEIKFDAVPANFGKQFKNGYKVTGNATTVKPSHGCNKIINPQNLRGNIAILERGNCNFINKVRNVEKHGAIAAIILDNVTNSIENPSIFTMTSDGINDVEIPSAFLHYNDGVKLRSVLSSNINIEITIAESKLIQEKT